MIPLSKVNCRGLRGITKVIKKYLVPSYRFKLLKNRPTGKLGYTAARRRGIRVDAELKQFVTQQKIPQLLESKSVLTFLQKHQIELQYSQYPVAWPAARLWTKIDLVGTLHGRVIVIEIKTGCLYRKCHTETGKVYSTDVTDSPEHQHQLQTCFHRLLLCKTLSLTEADVDMLLLYVEDDGKIHSSFGKEFSIHITKTMIEKILKTGKKLK
jgi:hypothetical protein